MMLEKHAGAPHNLRACRNRGTDYGGTTLLFIAGLAGLAILIFILANGSQWIAQKWHNKELGLRPDTLAAIATTAAAIAAGAAVWTALQQETATYNTAVHSKQVDVLGSFAGQASHLQLYIDQTTFRYNQYNPEVSAEILLKRWEDLISKTLSIIDVATLFNLTVNLLNDESHYVSEIKGPILNHTDIDLAVQNKKIADNETRIYEQAKNLAKDLGVLIRSASAVLATGRPLTNQHLECGQPPPQLPPGFLEMSPPR